MGMNHICCLLVVHIVKGISSVPTKDQECLQNEKLINRLFELCFLSVFHVSTGSNKKRILPEADYPIRRVQIHTYKFPRRGCSFLLFRAHRCCCPSKISPLELKPLTPKIENRIFCQIYLYVLQANLQSSRIILVASNFELQGQAMRHWLLVRGWQVQFFARRFSSSRWQSL